MPVWRRIRPPILDNHRPVLRRTSGPSLSLEAPRTVYSPVGESSFAHVPLDALFLAEPRTSGVHAWRKQLPPPSIKWEGGLSLVAANHLWRSSGRVWLAFPYGIPFGIPYGCSRR